MSEIVHMEYYDDPSLRDLRREEVDFDDSNEVFSLLQLLGNGWVEQARVTADTSRGTELFIAMLNKGGYFLSHEKALHARLFSPDCGCFPEESPFIFVNPLAKEGSKFEMRNIHSKATVIEPKSKRWWQVWRKC